MQPSSYDVDELDASVRDIVSRCLGMPPDNVQPESRLFTDLGADSLDVIDVVYQIERRLGVVLDGPERSFLAALNSVPPDAIVGDDGVRSDWLSNWRDAFPGLSDLLVHEVVLRGDLKNLITVKAFAQLVRAKRQDSAISTAP